jgi:hypothetical protein
MSNSENNYYRNNRNRNNNNAYRNQQENANYNRYYSVFHRLPGSRAERRKMEEELNRMNRDQIEENRAQELTQEEQNALNRAWDAYYAAQAEEERKYREEHPEEYKIPDPEQVWKLQMLHRKNPNLGDTSIAEELAMVHGNTRRLKRYVRSRGRQGTPLNQALNEYAEGGPFIEGVGRGPNRPNAVLPGNKKNLLTIKNAKKLNLLENYYGEYYDPVPGAYEEYSKKKANTRKRRNRKARKARKTRRN